MKNVITDAALEQEKYREDPHQIDTTENLMVEEKVVKNFLKNIKHFVSKDIMFVKI